MDVAQRQGRECYQRGEYQTALQHFNRAIRLQPSLQLLDNRSACHEKLGDLQEALQDAKRAIGLQREDATGYLRAGKVLIKMDRLNVALDIYSHGLRCIKHVGKGYELLRKAHKELLDRVSPTKSVDPMTVLPRELAVEVLEYLSFKQRINACLVSQQWAQFIRSCPDLWRALDLSQSRKKVRSSFISRAINTGRKRLVSADLRNLYDFDKTVTALLMHCPLRELALCDLNPSKLLTLRNLLPRTTHLKSLCMSSADVYPVSGLVNFFHRGVEKRLERLELDFVDLQTRGLFQSDFPILHTLIVDGVNRSSADELFMDIKQHMPLLRHLAVRDCGGGHPNRGVVSADFTLCPHLEHLDLKVPLLAAVLLHLPPSLVTLKLQSTLTPLPAHFWFVAGGAGLEPSTFFLPNLQELHLEIPRMVVHNALHALADAGPQAVPEERVPMSKLHTLAIRGATLNFKQVSEMLQHPRMSEVRHLYLPRLESCGDEDAEQIIDALPGLHTLDLSETKITGVSVRHALQSGSLRHLIVDNCPNISPDAIEWARLSGVKVQYRMSTGANGGRKMRQ